MIEAANCIFEECCLDTFGKERVYYFLYPKELAEQYIKVEAYGDRIAGACIRLTVPVDSKGEDICGQIREVQISPTVKTDDGYLDCSWSCLWGRHEHGDNPDWVYLLHKKGMEGRRKFTK
ncbi:hypothetical protein H6B07_04080 [Mediterraneibacter glycyrrhizinilyticus]|nr:hypothetical protein [Mediterraneibacter glycyrrhizinilyticus]MBM6801857.1 hypothetical protein [Mediterraneibacter glycyrrhizinilyticus]